MFILTAILSLRCVVIFRRFYVGRMNKKNNFPKISITGSIKITINIQFNINKNLLFFFVLENMPFNFLAMSVKKVEVQGEICTVHMKEFSGSLTLTRYLKTIFMEAYKRVHGRPKGGNGSDVPGSEKW